MMQHEGFGSLADWVAVFFSAIGGIGTGAVARWGFLHARARKRQADQDKRDAKIMSEQSRQLAKLNTVVEDMGEMRLEFQKEIGKAVTKAELAEHNSSIDRSLAQMRTDLREDMSDVRKDIREILLASKRP